MDITPEKKAGFTPRKQKFGLDNPILRLKTSSYIS